MLEVYHTQHTFKYHYAVLDILHVLEVYTYTTHFQIECCVGGSICCVGGLPYTTHLQTYVVLELNNLGTELNCIVEQVFM